MTSYTYITEVNDKGFNLVLCDMVSIQHRMYHSHVIFIQLDSFRDSIYIIGLCDTPYTVLGDSIRGFRDVIPTYNFEVSYNTIA